MALNPIKDVNIKTKSNLHLLLFNGDDKISKRFVAHVINADEII